MNETKIQELKDALREVMMLIAERGQPVSQEMKAAIVQVMEHVANRIQELRTPALPPKPEVDAAPFPSSNINGLKYDYKTGDLLVKFQDKYPGQDGPIYRYGGVPRFIFDTFRRGAVPPKTSGKNAWHEWKEGVMPSLGAAMYHLIRNNYPYQKVA